MSLVTDNKYLFLKVGMELGTHVFRSLVGQNTLGGLVVAVDEVADDGEMLTERLLVFVVECSGSEDQLLESVDVIAPHFEVTVILVCLIIDEVNADQTTNTKTSTKELGLVGSSQCELDRVVVTVLAANPVGGSSERIAGLGGTS